MYTRIPKKKPLDTFSILTVSDIKKQRQEKARRNHETYKEILKVCCKKIQSKSDANGKSIEFSIPPFVVNKPMFNINHACNYICLKLGKAGYKISRISDALIFIEW